MNRFTLFFALSIAIIIPAQAQQFEQCMKVTASAGGQGIQNNRLLTWTIGEPMGGTLHGTGHAMTQGFQQPESCGKSKVGTNDLSDWGIDVFPNPTDGWFTVRYSESQQGTLDASVFDLLGRPVLTAQHLDSASGSMIDAAAWPPGIYVLLLRDPVSKSFATYRITRI